MSRVDSCAEAKKLSSVVFMSNGTVFDVSKPPFSGCVASSSRLLFFKPNSQEKNASEDAIDATIKTNIRSNLFIVSWRNGEPYVTRYASNVRGK